MACTTCGHRAEQHDVLPPGCTVYHPVEEKMQESRFDVDREEELDTVSAAPAGPLPIV